MGVLIVEAGGADLHTLPLLVTLRVVHNGGLRGDNPHIQIGPLEPGFWSPGTHGVVVRQCLVTSSSFCTVDGILHNKAVVDICHLQHLAFSLSVGKKKTKPGP